MSSTLRDWWYSLLEPLAGPLLGIHPNTISAVSLVLGLLAGLAYGLTDGRSWLFFVAALLVTVSGIGDCFDGIVARQTGRTSAAGDFLDHVFDRLVDVAVLGGMALSPHATTSLGLGATVLTLLNSNLGTQIAASYGQRYYGGVGKGQLFVLMVLVSLLLGFNPEMAVSVAGLRVGLLDLFFWIVAAGALQAVVARIRLGLRLGREPQEK